MTQLPEPIFIERFKPIEVLKGFDPDKPIQYQDTSGPIERIATALDVIKIGKELYEAELKAWEGRHSQEILETIIDGAADTIFRAINYFEESYKRVADPKSRQLYLDLCDLYIRLKSPLLACMMESLGSIYIRGGMDAVKKVLNRLKERDNNHE